MKSITIILILCMFVGGASAGITYDAEYEYITVTGFNEEEPCNFERIYDASINAGWGVMTKQGNQYYTTTQIHIGDNEHHETWFIDSEKHISFRVPQQSESVSHIDIYNNALFKLKNCCVYFDNSQYPSLLSCESDPGVFGGVELYNSHLCSDNLESKIENCTNFSAYNCIFSKIGLKNLDNVDMHNVIIQNATVGLKTVEGDLSNIKIEGCTYGIYLPEDSDNTYLKNIDIANCDYTAWLVTDKEVYNLYLTDIITPSYIFKFPKDRHRAFVRYTFNIQTTPNAKITIMNHTDIVYQGYAYDNGTIDEQILIMGYYVFETGDTINSHNPYSIEIKKAGYHTYAQEFTLNEPIKWHILLLPDRVQVGSKIIRPARRS